MNFINILNIERLVLSSIFFDYEQIFEVSLILKKDDFYLNGYEQAKKYYDAMRLFCLDTQLISFNDIELMESEINSSF